MVNFSKMKQMKVAELLTYPELREQFVYRYNLNPKNNQGGAYFFDREIDFIKRMVMETPAIANADPISMYAAIVNLGYYGCSLDPGAQANAYIFPRGGNKVVYDISPWGELAIRIKYGVVFGIMGPTIVMEGDEVIIDEDRHVKHTSRPATAGTRILGAWVRVYLNKEWTRFDDKYYSMDTIQSWRKKSPAPNSTGWVGGVDGQPQEGMIAAKVVKHGLSTYHRMLANKPGVAIDGELSEDEQALMAVEAAYAIAVSDIPEEEEDEHLHEQVEEQEDQIPPEWQPPVREEVKAKARPIERDTYNPPPPPPPAPEKVSAPKFDF